MAGMKYILHNTGFLLAALLLFAGCVKETSRDTNSSEDGLMDVDIHFGSPACATVDVSTKSTLGLVRESNVFNLFLMVFDDSGKKVYGHYFDGENLNASTQSNWWEVTNMTNEESAPTHGTLHIKTAKKAGCKIVAVANMNPNDLDVSAGLLSTIDTYSALQGVIATQVRSEVAANSGFFLMSGEVTGVNIQGNTSDDDDISKKTLRLKRLYAKVTFNVRITPTVYDQNDPSTKNPIRDFIPYTWQVVNVPSCSYLLERTTPKVDAADTPEEFFSTEALGFEEETVTTAANDFYNDGATPVAIHSFSFYMMENRKEPASGITEYAHREKQDKNNVNDHGGSYYTATNGEFTYANPLSAYVVLTGKIVMGYDAGEGSNRNATLDANVRYVIHLGNFTSDVTDFDINRNYNYVYNIFISGANDIAAEVMANDGSAGSLDENEPGASGRVVMALEEIYDSDCHYSTQVISFHAAYMDEQKISWYVETPFNPDGIGPKDEHGNLIDLSMIDYKWVEFHVNDKDNSGMYSDKRVDYHPHDWQGYSEIPPGDKRRTMYVDELVDYLVQQTTQFRTDPSLTDFDNDAGAGGPKISVTAFINEYYYTVNPLSGIYDPTLWKMFVNGPMRRMHILASSHTSADGESDMIGSSFTIQQRAIQSIYAVHENSGLTSAWGMEFVDDAKEETGLTTYWKNKNSENNGNDSSTNGRLNTLKIWGLLNANGSASGNTLRWEDFMDMHSANETPQLKNDYKYLRYSCMTRNRDNDGDGIIDPEEIRWYMASDIQLIGVFLGAYGIEGDARLYQKSAAEQAGSGDNDWRQHIVASNRTHGQTNSNNYARVIWAEEGITGSNISYTGSGQTSKFSTRCVRNLGYHMEGGVRRDITLAVVDDPTVEPDPYIVMTRKHLESDGSVTSPYTSDYDVNTFYEFDCSRINTASLREPVDHELIGHDEFSKMACLSSSFEAAPVSMSVSVEGMTSYSFNGHNYNLTKYKGLNDYLDACFGGMDAGFSVCPPGYRLPNIREMAIIWNLLSPLTTGDAGNSSSGYLGPQNDADQVPSRTHWSKGVDGSNTKVSSAWGWGMMCNKILMAEPNSRHSIKKPRCVKDL